MGILQTGASYRQGALSALTRYSSLSQKLETEKKLADRQASDAQSAQNSSLGAAGGAMAGAIVGAEYGTAGGPIGMAVGAIVGGVAASFF